MRSRSAGSGVRSLVVAWVAIGLVGCGGPSPSSSPAPSPSPSLTATPSSSASPSSPGPTVVSSDAPSVAVDPGLLGHLPDAVDGSALVADPETAAGIAADPALATSASAIDLARVVIAGGSLGDDLAIASVVQLRPGVFGSAFFEAWRRTYDAAACASAGGTTGTSQPATIGTLTVYVGACAGGAATYHAALPGDVLVSITSVGARDLGRLVMEGLR